MGICKEDTIQNSGTIIFVILCFLLVLTFSGNIGNPDSSSAHYSSQQGLEFGDISSRHTVILCDAISLPDLYKFCDHTLNSTSRIPLSNQNKLSDCNRKIAQNLIQVQNIRLSIEPVIPMRLFIPLPSNKDDDLPVLN